MAAERCPGATRESCDPSHFAAGAHNRESPEGKGFQAELSAIRKTIQAFPLIEALKETMARSTGCDGWRTLRPPLHPLDAETRERLSVALGDIGFTMNLAA